MLHTFMLPAGTVLTGVAPLVQSGLSPRELADVQRGMRGCRVNLATSRQRCSAARDLLAAATECLVGSQHFLATSRASLGCDAEEHQS